MNPKVLKTLEFLKIKEKLITYASSGLGRNKLNELVPSSDFSIVKRGLEETDEAFTVLRLKGHVPLDGVFDIRGSVKRAEIGSMLSASELVEIASTIKAGRIIKKFIQEIIEEEDVTLPILAAEIERIPDLIRLEKEITSSIDEQGYVLDHASDTLRSIRNQIRSKETRIRERLDSIIRSSNAQKMLSDAIVTIRNDRYVIPVKQEYRGHYGGIVHDQSSSGQTLFIEPQVVVELNNDLQGLKVKEHQEIERILIALSNLVGEEAEGLRLATQALTELDFYFAKARFSKTYRGTKPALNNQGKISLKRARHPLISEDVIVENDIWLGDDFTTIVITGPNTGGKTVTLKTIGLTVLMAQSGLYVPAQEGSEVAVFDAVYADIGDEQSIEQNLSTFSSHMVNIVDILKKADGNSLVLFDELGAGTDPQEGAALAIAILDEVYNRGARVVATTHYPELKAYGYNREGVANASVEFDVESLRPTYKLLIGIPGRSNAFEISKRLGLQEDIINRARSLMSEDRQEVDSMIASLEANRRQAESAWEEARKFLQDAENIHKDLQKQMAEYYQKKDELTEKAKEKANQIIEEAKKEAETIIQELRQLRLEKNGEVKEHELIEARKRLEDAAPEVNKTTKKKAKNQKYNFLPGDEVKVVSLGQKGTLVEKLNDHEWQVQIGILKMKVEESDLEWLHTPKPVETKPIATIKGKDYHVNLELDLRGERFEDALLRVEKYIDDAILAGYPRVSIIHGKGTGALRQGVQNYLKNHRSVKSYRYGEAGEGGSGVTVVQLK
ncbi:endonuclease MutS2 [Bacillus litorisediminis]|uniref:endonuclease MutS2 n=1 Tax=Bacillus litorisediminis TaxID=2922713 RepID=UPI001FABBBB0|nr:endonuclease MutS2 [Bacillus litorisediminis]